MTRFVSLLRLTLPTAIALLALPTRPAAAQDNPTGDPVIARIYDIGMHHSQAAELGEVLMDSIGPRLTGSPANRAANDWLVRTYTAWGIPAHNEKYGTWREWTRGQSRVELIAPHAKTMESTMLAWSPATPAGGTTGDVVMIPRVADSAAFNTWLSGVRGKFVMISYPQPTCRPDTDWKAWATPAIYAAMVASRDTDMAAWRSRLSAAGVNARSLVPLLEKAGAAGLLSNRWSEGWGVDKVFSSPSTVLPSFDVGCEDYGTLARLAEHNQHPRVHAVADAAFGATEAPVYNTIAEVKGSEHPDEYVMLSAHLDSWDGGTGATDNGTGTITMLEAMRILRQAYPNPKRTILAGHWSGEEEGDIGSGAFAADHPEILKGLQALFNQDNGTGEVDTVQTNGFVDAAPFLAKWMSRMPADITSAITLMVPGVAHDESTDSDAFDCRNAPAFFLTSSDWSYGIYTWHTNRDTYDKISWANVERNATLTAMFAYEASEDPGRVPNVRRVPPTDARTGQAMRVPQCGTPPRSFAESLTRRRR